MNFTFFKITNRPGKLPVNRRSPSSSEIVQCLTKWAIVIEVRCYVRRSASYVRTLSQGSGQVVGEDPR
ncbi:hypothetical protein V1477_018861 [Vespula maculifrons]|uniref:Uncharacterized protein n=1 Tax=Vespula maculifrons TaxID=7453 RepID=A0ABD2ASN1_VESMC